MIIRAGVKSTTIGELSVGDEFEFMNSNKPWRVVLQNDVRTYRHLDGRGLTRYMRPDRKCFKIIYKEL